jgi:hypothetical protein
LLAGSHPVRLLFGAQSLSGRQLRNHGPESDTQSLTSRAPFVLGTEPAVGYGHSRRFERLFPVYPKQQTFPVSVGMSQMGPDSDSPQQQLRLFDHFVGAGEQKMRDCDLAELARVKRVNFPKAICA